MLVVASDVALDERCTVITSWIGLVVVSTVIRADRLID